MIFYFSGTGNSEWAAKTLGTLTRERVVCIADEVKGGYYSYTLGEKEALGFVFPIYSWAPPKMVLDFIKKLQLTGSKELYVFAVCTCGDEAGNAIHILNRALAAKGLPLQSAFSMSMPNNYIIGFDVDSKENEERKLREAEENVKDIAETIEKRQAVFAVKEGKLKFFKTAVISPLFNHFALNAKPFRVTEACVSCGLCERICPTGNIRLQDGKPIWDKKCTQCLACLHRCPARAVEYGKHTANKGRYCHPILRKAEGGPKA